MARQYAAKTDGGLRDHWNRLAAFWDEVARDREKEDERLARKPKPHSSR